MLKQFMKIFIRGYQLILSPFFGGQCRFYPTCSEYALECLDHHRPLTASWMIVKRIGRCHPFHPGGMDPVRTDLGGEGTRIGPIL